MRTTTRRCAVPMSQPASGCCTKAITAQRCFRPSSGSTFFLDGAVIEHFKSMAGDRDYRTLINDSLKQAIQAESLEGIVRKTIRGQLRRT